MTVQKYSTIRKCLFFISIIILLSGCDIIDEVMGRGTETENGNLSISEVEVEYFIDNVTYDDGGTGEHQSEFTSNAGTSTFENNVYHTIFNNPSVLGKKITGEMTITFSEEDGNKKVNIIIDQEREWNWDDTDQDYISGQYYEVICNNISYNKSYVDEFDENNVEEYYLGGNALSDIDIKTYDYWGIWGVSGSGYSLTNFTCGNRAYIKVKVHFE